MKRRQYLVGAVVLALLPVLAALIERKRLTLAWQEWQPGTKRFTCERGRRIPTAAGGILVALDDIDVRLPDHLAAGLATALAHRKGEHTLWATNLPFATAYDIFQVMRGIRGRDGCGPESSRNYVGCLVKRESSNPARTSTLLYIGSSEEARLLHVLGRTHAGDENACTSSRIHPATGSNASRSASEPPRCGAARSTTGSLSRTHSRTRPSATSYARTTSSSSPGSRRLVFGF